MAPGRLHQPGAGPAAGDGPAVPARSAGAADPAAPLRAVCLAGPTASGKTGAALAFAAGCAAWGWPTVEIVSVDSALVYRGLDIGSAKPDAAERAAVPHHGIDLVDPAESYSAARFVADAGAAIADIRRRGRLPLLVGGTMLYFQALREGLDAMPGADPAVRAALDARAAAEGWPALHAALARVDPVTAARLPPGDTQRIQRALEVWQVSGRPLSSWQRGAAEPAHAAARAARAAALPLVSLEPDDRGWLHRRIAARFDAMLAAGLLDEVRALRRRGDLHLGLPALRSVGYRQAWEALDAADAAGTPPDEAALREHGVAATRQLAKRQLTWLRGLSRTRVACDAPDALPRVLQALREAAAAAGAVPGAPGG